MERKEAIEVIKKNYPHVNESGSQFETALRTLIPELKESEDERIRKCIGDLIKENNFSNIYGVTKKECLVWLENQGEKKPVVIIPKFRVGDIVKHKDNPHLTYILKRFTDDGDYEFHAIGKDGNEGETCFAVVKYQDELELVEQNHAWSEEDEGMINSFLHKLEVCQLLSNKENVWVVRKLKSLKDRYAWKPNDLQIEALESVTENCAYSEYQDCLRELIEQLKKLKETKL